MTYSLVSPYRKYFGIAAILVAFTLTSGCSNPSQDGEHGHGDEHGHEEGHEHGHEHGEESLMATLTPDQIQSVGVTFGNFERKELTETIGANGKLKVPNSNKAIITSMFGGIIQSLNAEVGSLVRRGQAIATIAHPQLIELQEEYLTLNSEITFAEQEQQRQRELHEGNVGALKNLQSAEAELKSLRARKASIDQKIRLMGIDPNTITSDNLHPAVVITSPITGKISKVYAKIGTYVDVASPVAEVVDNSSLHLDLNVFEKDLPLLKVGQIVHFTVTNNATRTYSAKVYSISSSFENDSKTIPVHCTVTDDKSGLIDGMNVTGALSLKNVRSLAVPNDAIVDAEGKAYIFVVKDSARDKENTPQDDTQHDHDHDHDHDHQPTSQATNNSSARSTTFEKIEVVRGVSQMGYTAITLVREVPLDATIVTKGAFFINAKMSDNVGHSH